MPKCILHANWYSGTYFCLATKKDADIGGALYFFVGGGRGG